MLRLLYLFGQRGIPLSRDCVTFVENMLPCLLVSGAGAPTDELASAAARETSAPQDL